MQHKADLNTVVTRIEPDNPGPGTYRKTKETFKQF